MAKEKDRNGGRSCRGRHTHTHTHAEEGTERHREKGGVVKRQEEAEVGNKMGKNKRKDLLVVLTTVQMIIHPPSWF